MMEIVFPAPLQAQVHQALLPNDNLEACALLLAKKAFRGGKQRFLIHSVFLPDSGHYLARTRDSVALSPSFFVPLVSNAVAEDASLCFVHSHPFATEPTISFSRIDDGGEAVLAGYFSRRAPSMSVFSLVYGQIARSGRLLGSTTAVDLTDIGATIRFAHDKPTFDARLYDRQVRAFGVEGQQRLSGLKVGIVGLGGTGSIIAEQLAFLGVKQFLLFDPDTLETSNANRVVGARLNLIGQSKVAVAAANIKTINPAAITTTIAQNILERTATEAALSCDFLFSCTDSHGSRMLLNQIAYQYLIPCIDMGVAIVADAGVVNRIAGRVQMLAPGLPCLACGQLLDPEAIRLDFLPEETRRKEPYFHGNGAAQPAVISLNSTVASLATTMFLGATVGIPTSPRLLFYDGIKGAVRPTTMDPAPDCIVCSNTRGAMSQGDSWPLPSLP